MNATAEEPSGHRRLVSALIAAVLLLQLVPMLLPLVGVRSRGQLWPFLAYCMYAVPHFPGDETRVFGLVGTTASGAEVEVDPSALGTEYHGVFRTVWPQLEEPASPAEGQGYAERLIARHNAAQRDPARRIRTLHGVVERRRVTREGYGEPRREVLFSYTLGGP